jgi:hypothetical protein
MARLSTLIRRYFRLTTFAEATVVKKAEATRVEVEATGVEEQAVQKESGGSKTTALS